MRSPTTVNVLGGVLLLMGLAVVVAVIRTPPVATMPLAIGVGTAVLGALMIDPRAIAAISSLAGVASPYLPGGRRASDPVERPPTL